MRGDRAESWKLPAVTKLTAIGCFSHLPPHFSRLVKHKAISWHGNENKKKISVTFSSDFWAFGPYKKYPIINLFERDNKIEKSK